MSKYAEEGVYNGMANQEQLAILKQGVKAWNLWRHEDRPDNIWTDLREANLSFIPLFKANLLRRRSFLSCILP